MASSPVTPRSTAAILRDVHQQMRAMGLPARREIAKSYFPTAMKVYGVPVTELRKVVRALAKELKPAPPERVVEIAQAIVDAGGFESRQVAYEIIKKHPDAPDILSRKHLESLGAGMDNWASVDSFSCDVSGPAWREHRVRDAAVRAWARSKDRWWRRCALASTIALNMPSRGGSGDLPRTLEVCEMLADDSDEMVAKGLSWALRTLILVDPGEVEAFLDRHEEVLARRVIREVRNKLTTGRKTPGKKTAR